jgi:hypothetical protein
MNNPANAEAHRVDQFLMAPEARFDRWRVLLQRARTWERFANHSDPKRDGHPGVVIKSFHELRQWDDFLAYPGQALFKLLDERIASSDARRYGSLGSIDQPCSCNTLLSSNVAKD